MLELEDISNVIVLFVYKDVIMLVEEIESYVFAEIIRDTDDVVIVSLSKPVDVYVFI